MATAHHQWIHSLVRSLGSGLVLVTASAAQAWPVITAGPATVAPPGTIDITWSDVPGESGDWVGFADPTWPADWYLDAATCPDDACWTLTGGSSSGEAAFVLPTGTWVARLYQDGSYTLLAESAPVGVYHPDSPSAGTDLPVYAPDEDVQVVWAATTGTTGDWWGLAPVATPKRWIGEYATYDDTFGAAGGAALVSGGLGVGTYVPRVFESGGYGMLDEGAAFIVDYDPGGPPSLTASLSIPAAAYGPSSAIVVSYSGAPASGADWIGIAPAGSDIDDLDAYLFTTSITGESGSVATTAPAGTWEARLFESDSYTLRGVSAPFTVTWPGATPTLSASAAVVVAGEGDLEFCGTDLPTQSGSWIGITQPGAPMDQFGRYVDWRYTSGPDGCYAFADLPLGTYVARVFEGDVYNLWIESDPAQVTHHDGDVPTVWTDKATYAPDEAIVASWSALPGHEEDWLGVVPVGRPAAGALEYDSYLFTGGAYEGAITFDDGDPRVFLFPGDYELRAFADNGYDVLATATFSVAWPSLTEVSASGSTFTDEESIELTVTGLPEYPGDWVAIAPEHSPPVGVLNYVAWDYTGGGPEATLAALPLPVGRYVARAYLDDSFHMLAESAVFEVVASNGAPVAVDDLYVGWVDTAISTDAATGVLANDTDPDLDPLTASLLTGPSNGVLVFYGDGSFDYTPDPGFAGVDTFIYEVSDGSLTDEATVTVRMSDKTCDLPGATWPTDLVIDTAADMTVFCASGYSSVSGDVLISRTLLNHVDELSCLVAVGGDLEVSYHDGLENLDGLGGLACVGGSVKLHSDNSCDMDLPSLTHIHGDLILSSTAGLGWTTTRDWDAMNALEEVGGDLVMHGTMDLVRVSGFAALTGIGGDFVVRTSDDLAAITGFASLSAVDGGLRINNHPQWDQADVDTFVAGFTVGGSLFFSNNN